MEFFLMAIAPLIPFHFLFGVIYFGPRFECYLDCWKNARPLGYVWMTLLTLFFLPEFILIVIILSVYMFVDYAIRNSFKSE